MHKLLTFILCLVFAFNVQAKVFGAQEFYLDNGLRVIVIENHRAPIVKTMLWYKVGAMDESKGKSGLAHLLEHLMFRGTSKVKGSNFNELMLQNGVDFNAFTSRDFTVYHALSDISRLELVLFLEADRMQNLNISDKAFEGDQKIVYQERQQRIENNPKSRFAEAAHQILWQNTPYEHPIAGTLEEIKAFTKADANHFYRSFYAPNNAVLVLAGDIMLNEAKEIALKYFGKLKRKDSTFDHKVFEQKEGGFYYIAKKMEDIQTPQVSATYIIDSVLNNKKNAFALMVFSNYFGGSQNSFLQREFVKKHKVVAASSTADVFSRGNGTFQISLIPQQKTSNISNLAMIESALQQALTSLNEKSLEDEKKKMLSWFVYTKDNPEDAAYIVGHLAALGLNIEQIEAYEKNIQDVTLKDIQNAVTDMQKNAKKMVTILKPFKRENNQ